MPSGSSSPRRSGSNKNSSSPLLHSLLRTAVSALASDSSKDRQSSHRSGSSHSYPEPGHLPRSHTQPEPRRHGDYDSATGIPSHTAPSTSKEHTFQLLKTAAYELGKLVSDVEGKIKPTEKDKYRPSHIRSDDDRFEEVSDTETTISEQERRRHRNRDGDSRSGGKSSSSRKHRERARSAQSGRHREHHRGGHADAYYGYSAPVTPPTAPGQFGYNNYTQQFNPAAQTHSYPYPPPAPAPQQYNLNHNDNYTHPLPSPQPMYDESSERPQLKRSKTSASRFAGEMGGELMKNLPQLLDKAAWLLSLLEKKNAATGTRGLGSGGHSALLMALGLVMELYRSLGGAEKIRSFNEKRAMKKERMGERY